MANYEEKTVLMDEATSKRAVSRIAYEIVERNRGTENLVIIGIQTKGVSLAKLIIKKIEEIEGIKLELGSLDITFYRDDLTRLSKHPVVAGNDIAFSIEDKKIIYFKWSRYNLFLRQNPCQIRLKYSLIMSCFTVLEVQILRNYIMIVYKFK